MVTRIVQMTFEPENIPSFERIFEANKDAIRGFPGCTHLELLRETANPGVFFTFSRWESENALEAYRNSEFFRGVWAQTRVLFAEKPRAWTLDMMD
jgi:quinol monooxygenase YgiN